MADPDVKSIMVNRHAMAVTTVFFTKFNIGFVLCFVLFIFAQLPE
ncbi:hypothetical protein LYNGBM3L_75830 [Moorena producens 3L]|uniref:Uncharacterized protein n=1 Tax=Moorena producens 3L TaxID=489825 RepID=F4XRF6_9CYAN|nr:hypothetical protein LYNGBM3L_75830 [Moorena producens 3L]